MEDNYQIQIPKVQLGSQGLEVSRLSFGCGGLSGIYKATPLSHEAGCSVIKEAFDRGVTFFDTSDLYGHNHDNEIMVGKALKQLPREKVQLATKFGLFKSGDFQIGINGSPEYVRACCEASLKRLDVDYIDLYYQHRVDVTLPIEDTIGELKKLVNEGKILYIGLSEASVDTIIRAHAVHPITAVQMEYSLWTREIEDEFIPLCRFVIFTSALNITMSNSSSLGKTTHPRFNGENLEKNKLFYNKLANLTAKHTCTAPQLALAWLLHQGNDIFPIPGSWTTKVKNLDINVGSVNVKLTEEDLREISDAVPIGDIGGDREFELFSKLVWNYANTPST
ncbi:hypothetical protein ACLB2K_040970 [Fragaria x ananassa]